MTAKKKTQPTTPAPEKKKSIFSCTEDAYSLSLKVLPSQWSKLESSQQREIKKALQEIDDRLYTALDYIEGLNRAEYNAKTNPKVQYIDGSPVA